MIYLDNAATSFPKPETVIKETNRCIRKYCGNPGRSSHKMSLAAAEAIYSARERISNHFGCTNPECVVFTYNATYALNIAIKSFLKENCHVLISDFEHNSVVRPLEALKEKMNIQYSIFCSDGDLETNISSLLQDNTVGIICSIKSNVFNYALSLAELSRVAKKYSLFLIIDASQAAGHQRIDLSKTPCDAFCAPGHKSLFGIQGCGFVIFRDNARSNTIIEGGSGSESESLYMPKLLPEGYEAGTLSTPAIVSLDYGIKFIEDIGVDIVENKLGQLTQSLCDCLNSIENIRIYSSSQGIVTFNYKDLSSSVLSSLLDKDGICTRGGLHCAPMAHKKMNTSNQGALRVSVSYMNTQRCVDSLYRSIKAIAKIY